MNVSDRKRILSEISTLLSDGELKKARALVRESLQPTSNPSEGFIISLCGLCRKIRREGYVEQYCELARELKNFFFGEGEEFTPIVEGGIHSFCGSIDQDNSRFVKVTNDNNVEASFYRLVMDKGLQRKGQYYEIPRPYISNKTGPLSIIEIEKVKGDFSSNTGRRSFKNKTTALQAARAIAEFNSQMVEISRPVSGTLPLPLVNLDLDTKHDAHLKKRLDIHPDRDHILNWHDYLKRRWPEIISYMDGFYWVIANNDFHPGNFVSGSRYILIDNGASCFAPIGNDLYSLILHNISKSDLQNRIINEYAEYFEARVSFSIDPAQIRFASLVAYCKRYMKMSPGRNTDSIATFLSAQSFATELLKPTFPKWPAV